MGNPGENQQIAVFNYVKQNMDPDAIMNPTMDSTKPDIISPKFGIIEAKAADAQCGQFTITKVHDHPLNEAIMNAFGTLTNNAELKDNELCKKWVQHHYADVSYFGICDKNGNVTIQTWQEFFDTHTFSCIYRKKKSGSGDADKPWIAQYLPAHWKCEQKPNKEWYATNPAAIGEYAEGVNTKGTIKTLWVSTRTPGRVRILSDTSTPSFVFQSQPI